MGSSGFVLNSRVCKLILGAQVLLGALLYPALILVFARDHARLLMQVWGTLRARRLPQTDRTDENEMI